MTGRPPKYTDPEEMQKKIDQYFTDCEGEVLRDGKGDPVLDKWGAPIMIHARPPTSSGLARALGFSKRKSLYDYKGKKTFRDTITRAMLRLEEYNEERLYDKEGCNGAKFSLINNFGWEEREKKEIAGPDGGGIKVVFNIPRPEGEEP